MKFSREFNLNHVDSFLLCEEKNNSMPRLFVCVWIPKEIIERLNKLQNELRETGAKAKLVEEKNFHVTVTFLGDVEQSKINEIKMKLEACLKNVSEFHVNLNGLKVIPNENYIKVIGVNVKSDELRVLIKNVGTGIGGSFYEEQKITLCRVKGVTNKMFLKNFIEKNRDINLGSFHVKNVSLVKSTLTQYGPEYETIYKVKLKENEGKCFN